MKILPFTGLIPAEGEKTKILNIITNTGELPGFDDVERYLLQKALERADGNVTKAAKILGLSRPALDYRLKKSGIGKS